MDRPLNAAATSLPGPFDTAHHFAIALAQAFRLAHAAGARELPGYLGPLPC